MKFLVLFVLFFFTLLNQMDNDNNRKTESSKYKEINKNAVINPYDDIQILI